MDACSAQLVLVVNYYARWKSISDFMKRAKEAGHRSSFDISCREGYSNRYGLYWAEEDVFRKMEKQVPTYNYLMMEVGVRFFVGSAYSITLIFVLLYFNT